MTTVAPNPTKWLVKAIVDRIPSAVISGIVPDARHLDDGGYHVSINDLIKYGNAGDYSNTRPLDVAPPVTTAGKRDAAAHDISLGRADMIKLHGHVRKVWLNRKNDTRVKYVNAINCWKGTGRPTRFNFARGTTEDASIDHTYHEHTDQPRAYVDEVRDPTAAWRAARAVLSIVTGQSHDDWQQQEKLGPYAPKPPAPTPTPTPADEEDDMIANSYQLPPGYGYDHDGKPLTAGAETLTVGTPPASYPQHAWGKQYKLHLSLSGDHLPTDGQKVRVAIHDGKKWHVKTVTVKTGARLVIPVPVAQLGTAYNVTVGRLLPDPPAAASAMAEAPGSMALLVELLRH